jgi:hypothetical protein
VPKMPTLQIVLEPAQDAEREVAMALDALADALADRLIARARSEVAIERGVAEEDIDRENERVLEAARAITPLGAKAGDHAWS